MQMQLRSIAEIRSGYPFRKRIKASPKGGVAVVQMKDLDPADGLRVEGLTYVSSLGPKSEKHFLKPDDLVFQSKGYNNHTAVINVDFDAVAAVGLYVLRPISGLVTSDFLNWSINHPRTQAKLKTLSRGTQIPFIARADLEHLEISVPPLDVQHKIRKLNLMHRRYQKLLLELRGSTDQLFNSTTWQLAASQQDSEEIEND